MKKNTLFQEALQNTTETKKTLSVIHYADYAESIFKIAVYRKAEIRKSLNNHITEEEFFAHYDNEKTVLELANFAIEKAINQ